jgi:hypothetical protein
MAGAVGRYWRTIGVVAMTDKAKDAFVPTIDALPSRITRAFGFGALVLTGLLSIGSCKKVGIAAGAVPKGEMQARKSSAVKPIASAEEGMRLVDSFQGNPEDFQLAVPDALLDPAGLNMAIITDRVLARRWWPNGFEQRDRYRIYRYAATPPHPSE